MRRSAGSARLVRHERRVELVFPAQEMKSFRRALARLEALPIRC